MPGPGRAARTPQQCPLEALLQPVADLCDAELAMAGRSAIPPGVEAALPVPLAGWPRADAAAATVDAALLAWPPAPGGACNWEEAFA